MVFYVFLCCYVCLFLYGQFCRDAIKLGIYTLFTFFEHLFNLYNLYYDLFIWLHRLRCQDNAGFTPSHSGLHLSIGIYKCVIMKWYFKQTIFWSILTFGFYVWPHLFAASDIFLRVTLNLSRLTFVPKNIKIRHTLMKIWPRQAESGRTERRTHTRTHAQTPNQKVKTVRIQQQALLSTEIFHHFLKLRKVITTVQFKESTSIIES